MSIFISRNGETFGPFPREELQVAALRGAIVDTDLVSVEGSGEWKPVGDVPGLFLPPPAGAKSNSPKEEHRKNLAAYRSLLVQTAQKAQDDYDKAVMALSGGAIGLSLTFLKDVVGTRMLVDVIWLL